LLQLRREAKLSQTEIADIIGVSQNAYNRWEADKCKPLAENLLKISQYYHINVQELLDDAEKINVSSNDISGGNNFFANNIPSINTVNIQPPTDIIEKVLKMQEQISKLLESQFVLIEEIMRKK